MRASVGRKIASNIFIQSGFSLNSILSRMAIFGIFPFSAPVFNAAHLRVDNSCVPCGRAYCARWPHRNLHRLCRRLPAAIFLISPAKSRECLILRTFGMKLFLGLFFFASEGVFLLFFGCGNILRGLKNAMCGRRGKFLRRRKK